MCTVSAKDPKFLRYAKSPNVFRIVSKIHAVGFYIELIITRNNLIIFKKQIEKVRFKLPKWEKPKKKGINFPKNVVKNETASVSKNACCSINIVDWF